MTYYIFFFKHIREMKGESPSNLAVMKDAVYKRIIDVDYRNKSSADTLLLVACECLLPNNKHSSNSPVSRS